MRDYLYLWRDSDSLIASGIEFADLLPALEGTGGICLLKHDFDGAHRSSTGHVDFVPLHELPVLARDNIYDYGDFVWADYADEDGPDVAPHDLAALLYFQHVGQPLGGVRLRSLGNRFLAYSHDDGWFLRLYFAMWDLVGRLVAAMLSKLLPAEDATRAGRALSSAGDALWIASQRVETCPRTTDIDGILNERLSRTRGRDAW
jgi:hypothetical protein